MLFGISIIRWILIFLSIFMIINRFLRFYRKEVGQTFFKFLITFIIWLVVLIISVFPDFAYYISGKLGMGKSLNTLIFFGFVVVFMILFKILSLIEKIEKQISKIVRELALKNEK
ncbi:MAG: hypothetical protein KatS3mg096_888 [Candidatus Parcubacteria bacterium]|nr:MAG: hypothetical protein KatS3mg096_888 [Candidatus Parcubacteria bacterium]